MSDGHNPKKGIPSEEEPKMSNRWNVFIRGSVISIVATVLIGILNYVIRKMLSIHLSEEAYGFFYSAFALVLFFMGFLELGTNRALTILISKALTLNDHDKVKRIFSVGLTFKVGGGIIVFIGLACSAKYLMAHYFDFLASPWIPTYLFSLVVTYSVGGMYGALFTSQKAFLLRNVLELLKTGIAAGAVFAFVPRYGLLGVVIIFSLCPAITNAVGAFIASRKYGITPSLRSGRDRAMAVEILDLAKWIALPVMGTAVMFQMDTICLTWLDSLEKVARYNIALPIMQILQSLMVFPLVFAPIVAEMWQRGARKEIAAVCRTMTYLMVALFTPIVGGGILYGDRLITLLFDARFIDVQGAMVTLWVGMILLTISNFLISALSSGGYEKMLAIPVVIAVAVNISLNVVLIPQYSLFGAALATAGAYISLTIGLLWASHKHIGTVVGWDMLVNIGIGMVGCYLAYSVGGYNWSELAKVISFVLGSLLACLAIIIISPGTRSDFNKFISVILGKFRTRV